MIKKGFTLAEVLIALAIVGVIAALTIPTIMQNVSGAKVGPALAKFVNTFEVAAQKKMLDAESTTLTAGGDFNANEIKSMIEYFSMAPSTETITVLKPDGTTAINSLGGNKYVTKDGTFVSYFTKDTDNGINKDACVQTYNGKYGAYKGCAGTAVVVLNSPKSKHYLGKDTFLFIIDDSGAVVPYGSNIYKEMMKAGSKTDNTACNLKSTELKALAACTGQIADNGWKPLK